jgi:hypothetical protein
MLREQILNIQDRKVEAVEVPEWNTTLYVRTFTGADRARLMALHKKHADNPAELNTHLVLMAASDDKGNPIFAEADFDQLNGKSATAIDKVAVAALKLNGLDSDSVHDAKNA